MAELSILLSAPDVSPVEEEFVGAAIRSGWLAPAGPDLAAFESEVAERVGIEHAVAVSSGTAALHLALVSWGVGPGDVVPVSSLTFAATVNAIRYTGATPYLVDSEPHAGNISVALLEEALDWLESGGRRVPVVLPVDLLGSVADYPAIQELTSRRGIRVLSDAAESFGSSGHDRPAGAFGDAAVLSFNGNKIMTTSGGGMLLTRDEELAAHVRKLSTQAREPVAHYEHTEIGYNYRLSNILAALGRAQLSRLEEMIERRRGFRRAYRALVADVAGVRVLGHGPEVESRENCWLTALVIDPDRAPIGAAELTRQLALAGIESRPLWKPMHLQPVHKDLPVILDGTAENLFERGITLPSGSGMSEADFSRVCDVLASALEVA